MSLPRLPELDDDFELQEENDKELQQKSTQRKEKVIKNNNSNKEETKENDKGKENGKERRPKMPKSQYDNDGNPILTVPNLDDINLLNEIDKYFGKEVDD